MAPIYANRIPNVIIHYKQMEEARPDSNMLREIKWQYADMAAGGDGGDLGFEENGETTCRGVNYRGYPNEFFQEVCDLMMWER